MKKLKKLTATAMFAAIIFVLTALVRFPAASGYIHPGDSMIYICAVVLGSPWGALAGAAGGALADVLAGYAVYAPATVIIKAAIAFVFIGAKREKLFSLRNALLTVPAGCLTVGGYYLADLIIDKSFALADILGNVIQAAGSAVIFIILALAFDAAHFFKRKR